jgi:phytoene dehydrogenase-like protein
VEFEFSCTVENISADPVITGVTVAGGRFVPADIVVANADASNVYGSLLTGKAAGKTKSAQKSLHKATPSLSGFVVLLAMKGATPDFEHHNVFFPANYDDEFDAVFGIGKPAEPVADPTIYICSPKDSKMTPPGSESWYVLVNAPRHDTKSGIDWTQQSLTQYYADNLLTTLQTRGVEVASRVDWKQVISPADLERNTLAPGGSIYGTSSNGMRSAFLRPENVTKIPNLYLVGGSAHPGGGLPLVGMSAEIVATRIGRA